MPLVDMSKSVEAPKGECSGDSRPVPPSALTNLVGDTTYFVLRVVLLIAFFLKFEYHIALSTSPVYLAPVWELYKAPFEVEGQTTATPISSC